MQRLQLALAESEAEVGRGREEVGRLGGEVEVWKEEVRKGKRGGGGGGGVEGSGG